MLPAKIYNETRTRTITLTDRPPVVIDDAAWPETARAVAGPVTLRLRRHDDGRAIVYGTASSPCLPAGHSLRAGVLLAANHTQAELLAAIHETANRLGLEHADVLTSLMIGRLAPEEI